MHRSLVLFALLGCQSGDPTAARLPPPPGQTALAVGPLLPGGPLRLKATGLPAGQRVTWLRGSAPGPGTCFPNLGGNCLGVLNHVILGRTTADAAGIATLTATVPPTAPSGAQAWFQAGWVQGGVLELTSPVSRVVGLGDPDLYLTELAAQPTDGEFIEIYNASDVTADLSNVWIADYAGAVQLTIGGGAPVSSDLLLRFPEGATLAPGAHATVALKSATAFQTVYGSLPDYDLSAADPGAPAMLGTYGSSSGLTNTDEMVLLFRWDGASDGVVDLDYVVFGDTSDAIDRTGLSVGTHAYLPDTAPADQIPAPTHGAGESLARCSFGEAGQLTTGGNGAAGTDETSEDLAQTWQVRTNPTPGASNACDATPLAFEAVADFEPPYGFDGSARSELLTSASAFQAFFGAPPPAVVDFSSSVVLYHSMGPSPFPGSLPTVTAVTTGGGDLDVQLTEQLPGAGCGLLEYAPPAWTLVAIERPAGPVSLVVHPTATTLDCAAGGAADGDGCSQTEPCATGLVCHALTLWDFGFCRDETHHASFDGPGAAIPDDDPNGVAVQLVASGLTSVPEDGIVTVHITHPDPSQLTITLANLYDTTSVVWDREPTTGPDLHLTRPVPVPGDEDVNGPWTLRVVDSAAQDVGAIVSWRLELTSRYD